MIPHRFSNRIHDGAARITGVIHTRPLVRTGREEGPAPKNVNANPFWNLTLGVGFFPYRLKQSRPTLPGDAVVAVVAMCPFPQYRINLVFGILDRGLIVQRVLIFGNL